ncbi:MAG TPA: hypothetical protein PKL83_06995 [bacterium]|nr:hypothetical protein [bacterium]
MKITKLFPIIATVLLGLSVIMVVAVKLSQNDTKIQPDEQVPTAESVTTEATADTGTATVTDPQLVLPPETTAFLEYDPLGDLADLETMLTNDGISITDLSDAE